MLTKVRLSFDGGAFKAKEQEPPYLPDVFASRPIHIVGKWEGGLTGKLKLTGQLADGSIWEYSAMLENMTASEMPAVAVLWARSRIATLGDYEVVRQSAEKQITALGLEYSLMTHYTSFVAVDSHPSGPAACRAQDSNSTMSQSEKRDLDSIDSIGFASAGLSVQKMLSDTTSFSPLSSPLHRSPYFCIAVLTFICQYV